MATPMPARLDRARPAAVPPQSLSGMPPAEAAVAAPRSDRRVGMEISEKTAGCLVARVLSTAGFTEQEQYCSKAAMDRG
jgi:hypothetical protein